MEEAFLTTIREHQNIIYKVSRMYRDTREDQQDLFQEIVFQLWKAYPTFRGESKISTWMYRIALNTAISTFRKRRPEVTYADEIPEQLHPSDGQETSDREERMYRALRTLTAAERAIISLYLEEHSYKEIGEITGISESNVGVKLNRIKEKLRVRINQ